MDFISTSIISEGPVKPKNHTVSCQEKCVSFKDAEGLRSGLTWIPTGYFGKLY